MRLGQEPRGIIASGTVRRAPYQDEHWDPQSQSPLALYVDVDFDVLLDAESDPEAILDWDTLNTEVPLSHNWTPQASGISIPAQVAARLEQLWSQRISAQSTEHLHLNAARFFVQGRVYRRRDLHGLFGGQRQGGISTPADQPIIFLFTGEAGQPYGYQDQWTDDGLFLYTGEGQKGDMTFIRGNRAVRDHRLDGKDLHLFECIRQGQVRYTGQMICIGSHERRGPDIDGHDRSIIVFELAPIETFTTPTDSDNAGHSIRLESLSTLRERAFAASTYAATPRERLMRAHDRSQAIRAYVLTRANGTCEGCGQPAPFRTPSGRPFLETHHIRSLSDAGPDDPHWVIALCPNCHRRAHYANDSSQFNDELSGIVAARELQLADQEA